MIACARYLSAGMSALVVATLGLAAQQVRTKIEIQDVHLCCGQCVKAVATAVKEIEGLKTACNQDTSTITLDAPDLATAQKAVDAIAAAGYHGAIDADAPKFPVTKDVPEGEVESLKLEGIHNCCRGCTLAVAEAIETVDGVESHTLKPRAETFEIKGKFDAAAVIEALNAAGFHPRVAE